jgi:hypothetical protein
MDKILNKIIRQVVVEATTVKRLTNQVDSDTILNKLIKQVITEAAQKVVISKLDNKVIALTSKYGFGFKISANYPISLDQVRGKIQTNSQYGTSSPYNSYLNYTYFVGSNMHKTPDKKYVANVIIVTAKTMKSFNSAKFNAAVKYLLEPDNSNADVVVDGYATNTIGRKSGDLEAQHHKARGTAEAVYDSTDKRTNINQGSNIIFIDKDPGYATLPADLITVLTKQGAPLMSTSGSEVPGFMSDEDNVAPADDTKTDNGSVTANTNKQEVGSGEVENVNIDGSSIKMQTFTFGMKDNVDLKIFQDELKTQLKAGSNLTPNMKAFIATDKMTGYYGPLTSRLIVDLKIIFNYTNKDGKILEPDFQQTLIDKMQSKIKLTEQFNFTDDQLKLITNAPVLLDPVKVDIKKDDIKKDDIIKGDTEKVALTKAYQLCLDAAKDLRKITTTNPHDYWKKYLRWNGLSFRSNANENGIAWFKSAWNKAWGTKLAAAAKIRNTATQKNIKEINRRKDDVIDMIRKGGSMTVYLRIQNPFTGAPTDFKIKWDYLSGVQNAAFKGNPKKTVTNKQAQDFYNKKGKYRKPIKNPGLAD